MLYFGSAGDDGYEISIPLELALRVDRDVLVALQMNSGETIPRDHGYPIRYTLSVSPQH